MSLLTGLCMVVDLVIVVMIIGNDGDADGGEGVGKVK